MMLPSIEALELRQLFSTYVADPTSGDSGQIDQPSINPPVVYRYGERVYVGTRTLIGDQTVSQVEMYRDSGRQNLQFRTLTIAGADNVGLVNVTGESGVLVSVQQGNAAVLEEYNVKGSRDRGFTAVVQQKNAVAQFTAATSPNGDGEVETVIAIRRGKITRTYLARFDYIGVPDPKFGDDGFVQVASGSRAADVEITGNDLDGGYTYYGIRGQPGVTRLRRNGTKDISFGDRGRIADTWDGADTIFFGGDGDGDSGVEVLDRPTQIDGFAGTRIRMYTAAGRPDMSFGTGGQVLLARIGNARPGPQTLGQYNSRIYSLNVNGSLDTDFDGDGSAPVPAGDIIALDTGAGYIAIAGNTIIHLVLQT